MLGAVGLHQQVVDEVDAEVDVLQAGELVGALGLRVALAVDVERVETLRGALEQRLRASAREDLLPGVVALERRQVRARGRTAWPGSRSSTFARGARQPLDQRPREPAQAADARREQVGDVGVVAAEELVAALAREARP